MPGSQLYPLETNPQTGELFLRLPAPNDNIILTAPRMSDAKSLAPIINDPRVSIWLEGPPIPYRDEHAEEWLVHIVKKSEDILAELREEARLNPDGPLKLVGGCPVRHIREVLPDGTDIYLGDIGINRAQMEEVLDPDERKKAVEANNNKAVGDPSIVWTFGGMDNAGLARWGMLTDCDRLPCADAPWTGHYECGDGDNTEQVGGSADGGSVHGGIYVCWERRESPGV